jgi:hypothetical protein
MLPAERYGMENEALLNELNARATIIAKRHKLGKKDAVMAEQARRDEQQLLADTEALDEHPDGYDGPCYCKTCMSYD